MNKSFLVKIIGMLALITLMAIAVSYVNGIILERQRNQNQVKIDIAESSAHAQTIIGPILAAPYIEEYIEYVDEYSPKGVKTQKPVTKLITSTAYFLPENLHIDGAFSNDYKKLGIYKALMYQLSSQIKGDFRLPANLGITPKHKGGVITFQPATIGFGISDTRGISGKPALSIGNKTYKFEQGSRIDLLGKGIHATLGHIKSDTEQVLPFKFDLNLLGMENFSFTPIAETNSVRLQSSWQHPHFNGSFLPLKKAISNNGFIGEWAVSSLSSSNQSTLLNALTNKDSSSARHHLESLSIGFVDPINVYSQADRATKYGLLFIGLTFVGFFLFEVLKQLRIHPAQYTLVGLAMSMFYLLLVSFAEIIGFAYAYLGASTACILLLGYYLSHVLNSKLHGFTFAAFLTALYGALYSILASEDNALIMGSLLVFGLLATTMVITRKVDWYALNPQK
jgi:inner membrane protein